MGFLSRFLKKKPESVRTPRFAGHLYPEDAAQLGERVKEALAQTEHGRAESKGLLRAMIVPFAQLDYIAPILGACWQRAAQERGRIERVVLLGSALRVPFQGVAMSTVSAWESPLGQMWLDEVWREQMQTTAMMRGLDTIHEHEPALELQLPFLQRALGEEVTIFPLLMGDGSTEEMLHILEIMCAREGTLLVIATEIAYGATLEQGDKEIARVTQAILSRDAQAMTRGAVTARHPIRALLELASARQWEVTAMGATTSHAQQLERGEQLVVQDQGLMTGFAGFVFEG